MTRKILEGHVVSGEIVPGRELAIQINQTLATGSAAYHSCLELETSGTARVLTSFSAIYLDPAGPGGISRSGAIALRSASARHGIHVCPAEAGLRELIHLERFARPGQTLLASVRAAAACGGLGMLVFSGGILELASAMAGGAFHLTMPRILGVRLKGKLRPWVSISDAILALCERLGAEKAAGKILEFHGEGVRLIPIPERAAVAALCAELGAVASVFPSDDQTRRYLSSRKRPFDFLPLSPDPDAVHDERMDLDLGRLGPLLARSPRGDPIVGARDASGKKVDEIRVRACPVLSGSDLLFAARLLSGRKIAAGVSLTIDPVSRPAFDLLKRTRAAEWLTRAGATLIRPGSTSRSRKRRREQDPSQAKISLRSLPGPGEEHPKTEAGRIYWGSLEVCLASALSGQITDPRKMGSPPRVPPPSPIGEEWTLPGPVSRPRARKSPFPLRRLSAPLAESLAGTLLFKLGDGVTTSDILAPEQAEENRAELARRVFCGIDPGFTARCRRRRGGFLVAGEDYGAGPASQLAALALALVGVRAVLAKSFSQGHGDHLVGFGILPLTFQNPRDHERFEPGDALDLPDVPRRLRTGRRVVVRNTTRGFEVLTSCRLSRRQIEIVIAGGLLSYTRQAPAGQVSPRPAGRSPRSTGSRRD